MKKLLLFSLVVLAFFSSCRKDTDTIGESTEEQTDLTVIIDDYEPSSNLITGTVTGTIIDENEVPVSNAAVNLRGTTYTTDEYGRFIAKDITLDSEGTFYTVEKDGYFKGSRRFYPQEDAVNYTQVMLLELNNIGTFSATDGDVVTSAEDIQITFPSNAIKQVDGTLYTGDVSVAARWLDPTAQNTLRQMPGNLFGVSRQIEEVALSTFGMMAVELTGDNGEELNIADGKTAELSFPLPSSLSGVAPSEIPLWSFEDDQYGVWVEEGKATLQGQRYVGDVSHFSFWNCDAPFPLIYLTGTLETENGTPLSNSWVKISVIGSNTCAYGTTDSNGEFAGKVPKGEELAITIGYGWGVDSCAYESVAVGPFDVDTDLGVLQLADSGAPFEVTGSVVDCDGIPVTEGWVTLEFGNQMEGFYLNGSSDFTIGLYNCDNATEVTATATDLIALEVGNPLTVSLDPITNVGQLAACGNALTHYFTLTVDGETRTLIEVNAGFELPATNEYLFIYATDSLSGSQSGFNMALDYGNVGTYDTTNLQYFIIDLLGGLWSNPYTLYCQGQGSCTALSAFEFNITANGGQGGDLTGNFNGVGEFDLNGMPVTGIPFSGTFNIPID